MNIAMKNEINNTNYIVSASDEWVNLISDELDDGWEGAASSVLTMVSKRLATNAKQSY